MPLIDFNYDIILNNLHSSDNLIIEVNDIRLLTKSNKSNLTTDNITVQNHIPSTPGSLLIPDHLSGNQKFVTILCKFGDSTDFTPQPLEHFEELTDRLNNYWQEVSYNNINLDDSIVTGWYDLPEPLANYLGNGPGGNNVLKMFDDCVAQADDDIFFPDFDGINLVFNQDLFGGVIAIGNPIITASLDGEVKSYRTTWLGMYGWNNQGIVAHEMGHAFGLPHSSGPSETALDSNWDVMSEQTICYNPNENFGCKGPHTIAFYKDAKGWIDPSKRYIASPGDNQLIFLERLENPSSFGFLIGLIPIGNSITDFYSLESRKFVGLDKNEIPHEGVLIHKINLTKQGNIATVVDSTNNLNPGDKGAIWTPGETFIDNINNISVKVVKETETGFWVIINPSNSYFFFNDLFDSINEYINEY